jgi:hypothetical protein
MLSGLRPAIRIWLKEDCDTEVGCMILGVKIEQRLAME